MHKGGGVVHRGPELWGPLPYPHDSRPQGLVPLQHQLGPASQPLSDHLVTVFIEVQLLGTCEPGEIGRLSSS